MNEKSIAVILTAANEKESIVKALTYICNPQYSEFDGEFTLLQVSPDESTLSKADDYIAKLNNKNLKFIQLKDPGTSKPEALNMAFRKLDSEIIILTDGDVYFKQGGLAKLIGEFVKHDYHIACAMPESLNDRNSFMGYISHLMTAAADDKRIKEITNKSRFFPLSGYGMILNVKRFKSKTGKKLDVPNDCLVEDAYISYEFYNHSLKMGYIPQSKVMVKFPTTLGDYFSQKKRSTGGYLQLWKYGVVQKDTNSRSLVQELKYFVFPIKFAANFKEFCWSFAFYPVRLVLWIMMLYERKFIDKAFDKTWVRIESTK
jgi:cellulose synthase/poly-beta-1,6-N-acetylglucosamine synthase-like glycosyltransferase